MARNERSCGRNTSNRIAESHSRKEAGDGARKTTRGQSGKGKNNAKGQPGVSSIAGAWWRCPLRPTFD